MPKSVPVAAIPGIAGRLAAFVLERYPFALAAVQAALEPAGALRVSERDASAMDALRPRMRQELSKRVTLDEVELPDTTPGISAAKRFDAARDELLEACDGFLRREAIAASLTPEERREILRGMILTRAVDNRLKQFFSSGEVKYGNAGFQGKGFRSLGQEAIYAAGIRLRRGAVYRDPERGWRGDVVGPIIRDLGIALAMRSEPATVRMVLNAQMGKAGPPMDGKDFHIGDPEWGILPASAPLAISASPWR